MALIICPECGKEISDKAASCIHCGCPMQPPVYRAEQSPPPTDTPPQQTVYAESVRMSQKQITAVIALVAVSVFLPLILSRSGLYNFRLVSFVLSALPCIAVALIAIFQPTKKELLCVLALTLGAVISFVVPQFLYREPLTIVGLISYAVFFTLIVIYWLSATAVINSTVVPIIATIAYAIYSIFMVIVASTYGRYLLGIQLVSKICDIVFYVSGCIILCHGMKYRQRKRQAATAANGNYPYVNDAPSTGYAILCFCFPIVGLILYCVWRESLPKRAKSAGMGGLIGFCIGVALTVLFYVWLMS